MRKYELCLVLAPDKKKEDQEKLVAKIRQEILKLKGEVEKVEEWGEKELSYPIKKFGKGIFFLWQFSLSPEALSSLEKRLRSEEILRYLLLKANKKGGE